MSGGALSGGAVTERWDSIPDPLPHRSLLGTPVLQGRIKERPEDFLVDEIPLYEPCGSGEHLYLRVQRANMPHGEMMSLLAMHYGVSVDAIGFAGMKDKVGVIQQSLSVHLPGIPDPAPPEHDRIGVLWQARHGNKLRKGHLRGNRFVIRVRGVDPLKAPAAWRALKELGRIGVPDYFGPQRFGYRRNNHRVGRLLLLERWEELLAELLGSRGSPFPEHQRQQRELFDQGRYAESLPLWGRADYAERAALRTLAAGRGARRACMAIHGENRCFWASSLQSAIFNRVLDERVADGTLASLEQGDVAFQHHNGSLFAVDAAALADADPQRSISGRLESFQISPSGPLPGQGMLPAGGRAHDRELEAMRAFRTDDELFRRSTIIAGSRRPLRVRADNMELDSGLDDFGPFIRLAFDLPKGAYATVLLREIVQDAETSAEDHA